MAIIQCSKNYYFYYTQVTIKIILHVFAVAAFRNNFGFQE